MCGFVPPFVCLYTYSHQRRVKRRKKKSYVCNEFVMCVKWSVREPSGTLIFVPARMWCTREMEIKCMCVYVCVYVFVKAQAAWKGREQTCERKGDRWRVGERVN